MARRQINITVSISVDEDAVRLAHDHDSQMWDDTVATLRTALHHIALDNLDEELDPEVEIVVGRIGIVLP